MVVKHIVKISNDRLWQISLAGESVDLWLIENVGLGNFKEWYDIEKSNPYREFEFKNSRDQLMFTLRWL